MASISIVVPVYNSQDSLGELVKRAGTVLASLTEGYEVILVNDGSRDHSWQVISRLVAEHRWVRGFDLMRNYGQHNALLAGIRQAEYEVIITLDDDLQNPPEEIPKLIEKLDEGFDVVYGTPAPEEHGLWRNMASQVTKLALQGAMGIDTARRVSAFRAFRTQIRESFRDFQGPFVCIDVLLTWGTTRFAAIPVRHLPRQIGKSNYTFRGLVTHALNMMTGFSTWPLQLASLIGFGFTLFGFAVLVYVIGRYLVEGGSVPGFPFLASVIAIFSGAQLFALGIIGEYLARMHYRMMDRPTYAIRECKLPREGQVLMLTDSSDLCEILPWDTDFFGFRIARIRGNVLTRQQVERIDAWCRQTGVYCLYFLATCADKTTTELAEDNSFRLVDIRMTLTCSLPNSLDLGLPPFNDAIRLRQARAGDADALRGIARESYHDTRFYYDTNFPTHLSGFLYETWIKRSCEGYADVVFVAEFDEKLAGYIACHLDKEHRRGRIGLVGVSSHVRGNGIGQALVRQALDWFVAKNVAEVSVVTQGRSCTAQRLYQRSGFLTEAVQLWYHKWYRLPGMVHD